MKKDIITRAMTRDGNARIIVVNSKNMTNSAISFHKLSPTAAAFWPGAQPAGPGCALGL